MKKLFLLVSGLAIVYSAQSQTILTCKTHGLTPSEKNPMVITKYQDAGQAGQNVIWDFSNLESTSDFTGNIQEAYITKGCNNFPNSNTVLEEFGNYFFFNVTSTQMEQNGYLNGNGSAYIEYKKPFVKMKYPFSYNSSYSGVFEGTYNSNEKQIGEIIGTYHVTGDGIGTLLLPDGKTLKNTLRVKEVKSYKQIINNSSVGIEDVTYRWYVNEHRFPVLVFISSTYTYQNGQNNTSTRAAYNSNIINPSNDSFFSSNGFDLDIFPNPYSEKVNINLRLESSSKVNITVFDLIGKRISVLVDKQEEAGELTYNFSAKELGLAKGTYLVKVKVNNKETTRKIMEI